LISDFRFQKLLETRNLKHLYPKRIEHVTELEQYLKYKAVLFDFDGVIADTMKYHVKAWQQAFAEFNIKIIPEDIYLQEGQRADLIAHHLVREKELSLTDQEIDQLKINKRAIYQNITKARVYSGTKKIIKQLKKMSIKFGIVTGSIYPNIKIVTGDNFLENFGCIVTGDSVINNKPYPDPYLTGAIKLEVKPENCVVVENAPLGIKAAKAAGMYCIAVKTTIQDEQYLKGADLIVENMSKIPVEDIFL